MSRSSFPDEWIDTDCIHIKKGSIVMKRYGSAFYTVTSIRKDNHARIVSKVDKTYTFWEPIHQLKLVADALPYECDHYEYLERKCKERL